MKETLPQAPHKPRRLLPKLLLALAAVLAALMLAVLLLFQRELRTLGTLERVGNTSLFTMEYIGDYGFDDFLETGVSSDPELIRFIAGKLLKGLPMEFDLPDLGCSTFAAHTPEGDAVFGRNFDMYYSPALFVKTAPSNGLLDSFFCLAAPYVPLDGVNEKGVAVGVLLIDTEPTNQQTEKVDITTTTAIRMILDQAATVEEALTLLGEYDMHASANSCYHFQIADASGRAVVVEYIGDTMNVVESPRATNFLLTPGDWDFGTGQDRFETLTAAMEAAEGILTEEEAMDLLEAVSQQPQPEKRSSTQWSCVYNQSRGTVFIAMGMDYDHLYQFSIWD